MNTKHILCPSCKKWNEVIESQKRCNFCENELVPVSEDELKSIERRKTTGEINIPIHETDSFIKKILKRIFNFVQLIFLSILSFFLWLIAAGPG